MKKDAYVRDTIIGLILIIGGLVLLLSNTKVSSSWVIYVGQKNIKISTWLLFLPFIIAIGYRIYGKKSNTINSVIILGLIIIILSIINSIKISFTTMSMFEVLITLIMIIYGINLLIKGLFKAKKDWKLLNNIV